MLNPTPSHLLVDAQNRPYFLWDCEIDLDRFRKLLVDKDPDVAAYFLGKLMRQAKPDDVFLFATVATVRESWPMLERYLGEKRDFWRWLLDKWKEPGITVG